MDDDGAGYITASGSHYGQYLNLDGDESKDNHQLIIKYRGVAMHPEVDAALEDIINEAITGSEMQSSVDLTMDKVKVSDSIKKVMRERLRMLLVHRLVPVKMVTKTQTLNIVTITFL